MNYPRFRPGDKVRRPGKLRLRTVIEAQRIAGTYRYRLAAPGGKIEEIFETELRRGA